MKKTMTRGALMASSWLLALAASAPDLKAQTASFTDVTMSASSGLELYDASAEAHGPGAVFADLTCDGFPDLYLVRRNQPNELWINDADPMGNRVFTKASNALGMADSGPGQGAVAGDYDNDGDLDLYLLNYRAANVLYQNQCANDGGDCVLCFTNVTAQTDPTEIIDDVQNGVGMPRHANSNPVFNSDNPSGNPQEPKVFDNLDNSMTAAWGDVDRDGDLDLFVGNHDGQCGEPPSANDLQLGERDTLFLNQGNNKFWDVTMAPPPGSSVSAANWQEITGYEDFAGNCCFTEINQPVLQGGCANGGMPCDEEFFDKWVPLEYNSTNAAIFSDFDNDGWLDLFVTNKANTPADRDILYRNLGRNAAGHWLGFENVTYTTPTCFGAGVTSGIISDMGVVTGDLDNDGDIEAYSSLGGNNNIWVNELAQAGSLRFHSKRDALPAAFSWGVNFADFDNNGWLDAHIATQCDRRDYLYLGTPHDPQMFTWNFVESAVAAGVSQSDISSRGNPTADYDRDGWVDLFVVNRNFKSGNDWWVDNDVDSALFHNDSAEDNSDHHYLTFHLTGDPSLPGHYPSTRDAIGARVRVRADLDGNGTLDDGETLLRDLLSGSGNAASTSALDLHFGLGLAGPAGGPQEAFVQIDWPSGRLTEAQIGVDAFLNAGEGGTAEVHWRFDDDLLDVTARHDGSMTGPGSAQFAPGALGKALLLDGTAGVAVPESSVLNLMTVNARTISVWFRTQQPAGSQKQVIYEEGGTSRGLNIYLHQGKLYAGGWDQATPWQAWMAIDDILDNVWYHFLWIFDGAGGWQAGLLDTEVAALGIAAPVSSHPGDVRIGTSSGTTFHDTPPGAAEIGPQRFVGEIDDLRVYNRILIIQEIEGIFAFGNP